MTDGSVPPLCQAGFNPTALWLRSSVSLMMRKDGAGQRFDRGEQCETDTCLCRMYELLSGNGEALINDGEEKLGRE